MTVRLSRTQPTNPDTIAFLENRRRELLINGDWSDSASNETIETCDPATGQVIAEIAAGNAEDIDNAVKAARAAFESGPWPKFTPSERGRLLMRVAELMEDNIEMLAELETLDQGKPLFVGRWAEIPGAIEQFRFFAGECTKIQGRSIPTSIHYQPEGKEVFAYTRKEPIGVVGAIVPWNSPLVLTAMKLAPALAAGCTIVLKPAEDTSLTAIKLGEIFSEAGFPEGVLNIVTGYGHVAGDALARHAGVDKIAFTGSTATGRKILDAAKGNLKKVTLELGGKSPVVLLEDCDLSAAIEGAANAIFFNGGQVCVAGSRLYVHSSIFDDVLEGVVNLAKQYRLGHGLDPETQMGPLINCAHAQKVSRFVARASEEGCSIECGGNLLEEGGGSFYEPTVITGAKSGCEIVKEEVFGPVVVCEKFSEIDAVLSAANDTDYGLAASVWTQSLSNAHTIASALRAGTVWINSHSMFDASLPIGGVRQSGWGRDSGRQAVDNYIEEKTVCAVI